MAPGNDKGKGKAPLLLQGAFPDDRSDFGLEGAEAGSLEPRNGQGVRHVDTRVATHHARELPSQAESAHGPESTRASAGTSGLRRSLNASARPFQPLQLSEIRSRNQTRATPAALSETLHPPLSTHLSTEQQSNDQVLRSTDWYPRSPKLRALGAQRAARRGGANPTQSLIPPAPAVAGPVQPNTSAHGHQRSNSDETFVTAHTSSTNQSFATASEATHGNGWEYNYIATDDSFATHSRRRRWR